MSAVFSQFIGVNGKRISFCNWSSLQSALDHDNPDSVTSQERHTDTDTIECVLVDGQLVGFIDYEPSEPLEDYLPTAEYFARDSDLSDNDIHEGLMRQVTLEAGRRGHE